MATRKNNNENQWVYLTGKEIYNFLSRVKGRLKGITVYALVGKSGTGKSFRAKLLAEKIGIPYIIDDGLLILGDTILAGRSAKQEKLYVSAIKTALFVNRKQREDVIKVLRERKVKQILLLGTSSKMVEKLASQLDLPPISQIIQIEEIANQKDIEAAIADLEEELKGDNKEAITEKTTKLTEVAGKLAEKAYAQEQASAEAGASEAPEAADDSNANANGDDIVDAEFEEVEDEKK